MIILLVEVKSMHKTVAIKKENGLCSLVLVCNTVDEKEYNRLLNEQEMIEQGKLKDQYELLKKIDDLVKEVNNLKQEVKLLKGEE